MLLILMNIFRIIAKKNIYMPKLRLIGFAGRKRSGKTSLSKIMEKHYNAVTITAANYLKQLCAELLSVTLDELNVRKDDGTTFSRYSNEEWSKIISNATGIGVNDINETIGGVEFTTVRQLLQVIGTDLIRKYKPSWHVDKMREDIIKQLDDGRIVTVDDIRFENEVKTIKSLGGECFFIIRPCNLYISNHISEQSLSWLMFDKRNIIINDGIFDILESNFIWHYENDFADNPSSQLLLSEKPGYTENMNIRFGTEKNELVNEILKQNKDSEVFLKRGIITFTPTSEEMNREFMHEVYNSEPNGNVGLHQYMMYNPIINENLKIYL